MIHEEVSLPSLETHVRTTRSEGSAAWFLPSFGINSTGMMYRTNETKLKFPDPYPTQKQGCFKLSMRLSSFHVPCPFRTCTWTHAIDEQLCERSLTEEPYYLLLDTSKYPPYHTSIITSIIICNSSTHRRDLPYLVSFLKMIWLRYAWKIQHQASLLRTPKKFRNIITFYIYN